MSQTPVATGTSTPIEFHSFASVVGINFGNSYASIAVLAKVRTPPFPPRNTD